MRALPMDLVEWQVEQLNYRMQLPQAIADQLQELILSETARQRDQSATNTKASEKRKARLLDEQAKLLQAHYADAVPLELLKSEQERIKKELGSVEKRLVDISERLRKIEANLQSALIVVTRLGASYTQAKPDMRRRINQDVYTAIYVDEHGLTRFELKEPFELLLSPPVTQLAQDAALIGSAATASASQEDKDNYEWRDFAEAHSDIRNVSAWIDDADRELLGVGAGKTNTPNHERVGGVNVTLLVGLTGRYANPDLRRSLERGAALSQIYIEADEFD